ncbi:hypothetical protein Dimus_010634, partial [Dionaea muscipula]
IQTASGMHCGERRIIVVGGQRVLGSPGFPLSWAIPLSTGTAVAWDSSAPWISPCSTIVLRPHGDLFFGGGSFVRGGDSAV